MSANAYLGYLEEISNKDRKNDEIIKSILEDEQYNNISGITADEIENVCGKISGGKGDDCRDQLDGTRKSGKSDSLTLKYWKAVSKGYKGTIDEFEKRQNTLSKFLGYGLDTASVLSGLVKPHSSTSVSPDVTQSQGMSTGAKVGIAIGVLAVLGVGIYFVTRK